MNGQNRIMADTGGERLIPLAVTGDGMIKLFNISVLVAASEGGVVLIDEIDNGLHHSVMQPFWKALLKMATDHNVRILATTHNDELLRNAIEAFGDDLSVLELYRLDRVGDRVEAVSYSEEALAAKRELDIEVRG
jgi:AAA15 family ATPase/GTPase